LTRLAGLSRALGFPLARGWWRAKSLTAVRLDLALRASPPVLPTHPSPLAPHLQVHPSLAAAAVAAVAVDLAIKKKRKLKATKKMLKKFMTKLMK
jgi:hypothetical protein